MIQKTTKEAQTGALSGSISHTSRQTQSHTCAGRSDSINGVTLSAPGWSFTRGSGTGRFYHHPNKNRRRFSLSVQGAVAKSCRTNCMLSDARVVVGWQPVAGAGWLVPVPSRHQQVGSGSSDSQVTGGLVSLFTDATNRKILSPMGSS